MRIAVVGSGPAGLMTAEVLASHGCAVTVYEQHRSPGRKFLLAGRSGLNLTHSEPLDRLLERYGPDRPHLETAIRGFDAQAVQAWCADLGEAPTIGSSGRVFPASHRATPLLRAWLGRLEDSGVVFRLRHRWTGWADEGLRFEDLASGDELIDNPDAAVLACGGPSWPRVGGDGSWSTALAGQGVEVTPFGSANCGVHVAWTAAMLDRFDGSPIKNVALRTAEDTTDSLVRGDIVVTRTGLEGGPVYALSRPLRTALDAGRPATVEIDLTPDLDAAALTARLSNRRKGATQTDWLRSAGLSPVSISLLRDVTANQLSDEPAAMVTLIKTAQVPVTGLASLDRAISSSGGVRFDEVDDHLMVRKCPGTFVAGEMLDWEAPTGGYLLQACLSTGVAAAHGVLAYL